MATPLQLTPEIATSLMQRSMTTGVPTFELQQYGGEQAVRQMYEQGGGKYDLSGIAAPTLQNLASQVATSGIGNLAALERADIRLAPQALTAMQQHGIAPSTVSGISALDIAPLPAGYEYFAPSQVAATREFLKGDQRPPTADEIYQRANQLKLNPAQLSSLLSLAQKSDLKSTSDLVNKYLASTGKTLAGGFTQTAPTYYTGIANLPGAETYQPVVSQAYKDVLGRTLAPTDPGLAYYVQQLQSGALKQPELATALAYGATSLADQLAAQKYLGKDIFGKEADLRSQFETGFGQTVSDVFGSQRDIEDLEKMLSLPGKPFKVSELFQPKYFESAGSLTDIKKQLQESELNKYQEAERVAQGLKNLYGYSDETLKTYANDLLKGKAPNDLVKEYYDASLKGTLTPELERKLIADAAKKAPDSPYFKANPQDLLYAKPAGEIKRGEETSYTYGADPKSGLPLIHAAAFENTLDKDGLVRIYGAEDFTNNIRHQYIGADPHSRHQGMIARGVGALGVDATKKDIEDFAKIRKEIDKFGGIQVAGGGDSGTVEYVEIPSESGEPRRVRVEDLFDTGGEFAYNGADRYKLYRDTQDQLNQIALSQVYKDPNKVPQYKDIKEQFEDLNNKTKDLYVWQGRTDTLDPEALKKLGIENPEDNSQHIRMYLEKKGDWLVPRYKTEEVDGQLVEKPLITPFNFSDPNTTSGFVGDIINFILEVATLPPVSAALTAGAFGPGGFMSKTAESIGGSILQGTGLDFALAEQFNLGLPEIINLERQIGSALLSSGISALPAARTGGLEEFGEAFGKNLAGSGVQIGSSALGAPPIVSKALGTATTAAMSDQDVEDAILRLAQSEGINTLLNTVGTKGDFNTRLMSAMAPAILSGKLTPGDIMRISQSLNQPPPKK